MEACSPNYVPCSELGAADLHTALILGRLQGQLDDWLAACGPKYVLCAELEAAALHTALIVGRLQDQLDTCWQPEARNTCYVQSWTPQLCTRSLRRLQGKLDT